MSNVLFSSRELKAQGPLSSLPQTTFIRMLAGLLKPDEDESKKKEALDDPFSIAHSIWPSINITMTLAGIITEIVAPIIYSLFHMVFNVDITKLMQNVGQESKRSYMFFDSSMCCTCS